MCIPLLTVNQILVCDFHDSIYERIRFWYYQDIIQTVNRQVWIIYVMVRTLEILAQDNVLSTVYW